MDDDDSKQGSDKFEKSTGLRLEPVWSLNGQYSRMDTKGLDTSALADLAHAGPTLVVLNDFERLVVTAGAAIERARDHCRLLLRALLEQCSNIKVLMTCSSFSGIGRVPGLGLCGIKFRAPHAIRSCVYAMAWRFHAIDATLSP